MNTTGNRELPPRTPLQAFALAAMLAGGVTAVCAMRGIGEEVHLPVSQSAYAAPDVAAQTGYGDAGSDSRRALPPADLEYSGPSISSEGLTWEFGEWEAGVDLQHVFTLRNDGDTPLHIVRAKPG